jgi:hypothetical protein
MTPLDPQVAPPGAHDAATATEAPSVPLHWVEEPPQAATPAQWGVPWPRGRLSQLGGADDFAIRVRRPDGSTTTAPLDSWVTAHWPDGSVKWTGHAGQIPSGTDPSLVTGRGTSARDDEQPTVRVAEADDAITVDTGVLRMVVAADGPGAPAPAAAGDRDDRSATPGPIRLLEVDGRTVGTGGRIVASSSAGAERTSPRRPHRVRVTSVQVERAGDRQVVLRLDGHHEIPGADEDREPTRALPFVLRLYARAGSARLRMVHSLVWDADPQSVFLTSLGVHLDVPLRAAPYDRHVRLAGGSGGMLTEAVQGVTGLRRDPGQEVRRRQVEGRALPDPATWDPRVTDRLHWVPCWNDWTLRQTNAHGYTVAKRTATDRPFISAGSGRRSDGYAYLGDTSGGIGLGLRDFWKRAPTQLDVTDAATDTGGVTAWMYAPSADPMDLRFYHDGLGQDTFADQLDALEITYEDYEPGFGEVRGTARTHELVIDAFAATPSADELAQDAATSAVPPQLLPTPERLHAAGVFGTWDLPDHSTPERARIEDRLVWLREFYRDQVDQRGWYGFWDHGDVMHTYDEDRHTWRYDVGGYAWDNSELSPDLWLWTDAIRSGSADAYRLAEAMTRHTSEVDVYHSGRFAGLGSRHNVQHFGCSAKQLRISNAVYRRYFYYLTADERTGELLDEIARSEEALVQVDATRKVRTDVYAPDRQALAIGLGTDLGALLGAWLTAWERHGDQGAERKLRAMIHGIGELPNGLFTGEALWDMDAGVLDTDRERIQVSHLAAVFGMVEIVTEILEQVDDPGFEQAWIDYCRYYLATPEEQTERFGAPLTGISLVPSYSRLLAIAADHAGRLGDAGAADALADRAWDAFFVGLGDQLNINALVAQDQWERTRIDGPTVLEPVDEAAFVSTNDAAQYGLAAIQNLALIGDRLPEYRRNHDH